MELIIRTTHNELQDEIDKLDEDMDEIIDTDSHEIKCDDIGEDMIITLKAYIVIITPRTIATSPTGLSLSFMRPQIRKISTTAITHTLNRIHL